MAMNVTASAGCLTVYDNGAALLFKKIRFSYPNVILPTRGQQSADYSYSIQCLVDVAAEGEAVELLHVTMRDLLAAYKADHKNFKIPSEDRRFYKPGDADKAETAGMLVVSARNQVSDPPVVVDRYKKSLVPEGSWLIGTGDAKEPNPVFVRAAKEVYGGCYGNLVIRPWVQDNSFGTRLNAGIVTVQKTMDGEPFGSAIRGDQAIGLLGDDEPDSVEDDI